MWPISLIIAILIHETSKTPIVLHNRIKSVFRFCPPTPAVLLFGCYLTTPFKLDFLGLNS